MGLTQKEIDAGIMKVDGMYKWEIRCWERKIAEPWRISYPIDCMKIRREDTKDKKQRIKNQNAIYLWSSTNMRSQRLFKKS